MISPNPLQNPFPPNWCTEYPQYTKFVEWINSGFGTSTQWNWQLFDSLYRSSWVAQRCVTVLADDICDKWRKFEHPDPKVVEQRTAYEEENRISSVYRETLYNARLYGGAAQIPILKSQFNSEAFATPFDITSVKKDDLHGFQVLCKYDFAPEGGINRDVFLSPQIFGDFITYKIIRIQTVSNEIAKHPDLNMTMEPVNQADLPTIHTSRMVKFFGTELMYYQKLFAMGWGDSILTPIIDKIPAIEEAFHLMYLYLDLFNVDEVKIPNLATIMKSNTGPWELIKKYKSFRDAMRNSKLRFMDSNDEMNRNQLSSIQNIVPVFQALVQFVVGSTGIPITRMLGDSVSGLTSTGDNELTQYYDLVFEEQKKLGPQLKITDEIIERSMFGKKMDIKYRWLSKREMTEKESAETANIKSQTFQNYVNMRVMTPKIVADNIQDDFNGIDEKYKAGLEEDFLEYAEQISEMESDDADSSERETSSEGDAGTSQKNSSSEEKEDPLIEAEEANTSDGS